MVDVERWLSYKGTCHVILLAKLHDMFIYKTDNFFHINHYSISVSKVALLHRFHCIVLSTKNVAITLIALRKHINNGISSEYLTETLQMRSGPEVIKHFSCSTQLSMKFFMLISNY